MDRALQRHRGRRRHIRDCIYRRRVMAGTGRRICPEVPSGLTRRGSSTAFYC